MKSTFYLDHFQLEFIDGFYTMMGCYVKATKRQPGTSGRLHRTVTGEWVWSSEEEGDRSSDEEVMFYFLAFSLVNLKLKKIN